MMGVYKITNEMNGKCYVGSSKNVMRRLRDHQRELEGNKHVNKYLQNAFNKNGGKNFRYELLEVVEDEAVLREREQYYMDLFCVCERDKGYNINALATGGGKYGEDNGWFGKGHLQAGPLNQFYGKTHTEETKKLISGIAKKRKGKLNPNFGNRRGNNPISRSVLQVDPETFKVVNEWDSVTSAYEGIGAKHTNGSVSDACKAAEGSVRLKRFGFYWCYSGDLEKLLRAKDYVSKRERPVLQLDKNTGEVIRRFKSCKEAADEFGIGLENISRACSGRYKTVRGYKWKYDEVASIS